MFNSPVPQNEVLVKDLLDDGTQISTVHKHGGALSVATLRSAHELQESGAAIGKTVLDGFSLAGSPSR